MQDIGQLLNINIGDSTKCELYLVKKEKKYGVLDANQRVILPTDFKEISVLEDTVLKVVYHQKWLESFKSKSKIRNYSGCLIEYFQHKI